MSLLHTACLNPESVLEGALKAGKPASIMNSMHPQLNTSIFTASYACDSTHNKRTGSASKPTLAPARTPGARG